MKPFNLLLSEEMYEWLREMAFVRRSSIADLIRQAVEKMITEAKKEGK